MAYPRFFGKLVLVSLMVVGLKHREVEAEINEVDVDDEKIFLDSDPLNPVLDSETAEERYLVLISNMDGSVSALNARTGDVKWSLMVGIGPLLSSSISDVQIMKNGIPSRLVPSLDGGLYQMDKEGIEPVPLAADLLLTSTFKLTDDAFIVGGKEIETYGVEARTGKLRYICSSAGCRHLTNNNNKSNNNNNNDDDDDDTVGGDDDDDVHEVLVIKRTDRTIRMVDVMDGQEKWNYSVGHHDLTLHSRFVQSIDQNSFLNSDTANQFSFRSSFSRFIKDDITNDLDLKIKMSTGFIHGVSKSNPLHVYWAHQFDTSIAGAWMVRGSELKVISLFDDSNIIYPSSQINGDDDNDYDGGGGGGGGARYGPKLLYIGVFNDMLYIQPSEMLLNNNNLNIDSQHSTTTTSSLSTTTQVAATNQMQTFHPRVKWRPYLATATSRTKILSNRNLITSGSSSSASSSSPSSSSSSSSSAPLASIKDKSLILPSKELYPFDGGYYLHLDYTPLDNLGRHGNQTRKLSHRFRIGFLSMLAEKWKELTLFIIVTFTSLVSYCKKVLIKKTSSSSSLSTSSSSSSSPSKRKKNMENRGCSAQPTTNEPEYHQQPPPPPPPPDLFVSRYLTDFEPQECLGKGGFGVVFKAYNRIDECSYAVKRIAIHDSKTARSKVMREVKALAKLDHPGIVRYYQSWFECPPPGWQEEMDRLYITGQSTNASLQPITTSCGSTNHIKSNGDVITNYDSGRVEVVGGCGLVIFESKFSSSSSDNKNNNNNNNKNNNNKNNNNNKKKWKRADVIRDDTSESVVFMASNNNNNNNDNNNKNNNNNQNNMNNSNNNNKFDTDSIHNAYLCNNNDNNNHKRNNIKSNKYDYLNNDDDDNDGDDDCVVNGSCVDKRTTTTTSAPTTSPPTIASRTSLITTSSMHDRLSRGGDHCKVKFTSMSDDSDGDDDDDDDEDEDGDNDDDGNSDDDSDNDDYKDEKDDDSDDFEIVFTNNSANDSLRQRNVAKNINNINNNNNNNNNINNHNNNKINDSVSIVFEDSNNNNKKNVDVVVDLEGSIGNTCSSLRNRKRNINNKNIDSTTTTNNNNKSNINFNDNISTNQHILSNTNNNFDDKNASNKCKNINNKHNNIKSKHHNTNKRNNINKRNTTSNTTTLASKLYLYIQMQLCQRESLQTWLIKTTFDLHLTLDIFHQIVSAISYVHDLGLMHRDLKPSNIFFAMDGSVKIGDFGLVTAVEETYEEDGDGGGGDYGGDVGGGMGGGGDRGYSGGLGMIILKQHTNQVGTRLYMSPEQTTDQGYDNKVDIYALGVIFFEMFHRFSTQMERIKTLQDIRNLKFPETFVKQFPKEYKFMRPLLSHTPSDRPTAHTILLHDMLSEFEGATLAFHRLHSQSRMRNPSMSSSSNNTNNNSSSTSPLVPTP